MGRGHPLIRTQYFCENIDAQGGMFTAAHRALMKGDRPGIRRGGFQPPSPTSTTRVVDASSPCAFLLDVAGQEESSTSFDPATIERDFTEQLTFPLGIAKHTEAQRSEATEGRGVRSPAGRFEPQLNGFRDAVTLRILGEAASSCHHPLSSEAAFA
jgi:hypothetical protein